MLSNILNNCENAINQIDCCKGDNDACDCISSLMEDYSNRPDSYDCDKKMSTYVLRYGPIYASEIYHYLEHCNFSEWASEKEEINIISLGCGFAPDYAAVKEYLSDYEIDTSVNYLGLDKSSCWEIARPENNECEFINADLTRSFDLSGADIVFVCKVFSTLYRNDLENEFLNNFEEAVRDSLSDDAIVVFVDINNYKMGRDAFHNAVKTYLPNYNQYYFDGYTGNNWTKINKNGITFSLPRRLSVTPLNSVGRTVIFDYRK